MKKTLLAFAAVALLAGCGVNPEQATRILESQGYTEVRIGGYAFFGCSEHDSFRSKFTATGANGQQVNGVICGGLLKGYTVRFD